jgi:(p)ppGpp synthase/HD superfamily hydrolase
MNIEKARNFAIKAHGNQKYGDKTYVYHLDKVAEVLQDFGYSDLEHQVSAYLHDILEDTDIKPAEIAINFTLPVYMVVWACTGEGKNRKERQLCILSRLTYFPKACLVKLADRIANIEYGILENNDSKFKMYLKEDERFQSVVKDHVPEEMLNRLRAAMTTGIEKFGLKEQI